MLMNEQQEYEERSMLILTYRPYNRVMQCRKRDTGANSLKMKGCFGMCNRYVLLPVAGNRNNSNGSLNNVGSNGNYWSGTVDGTNSRSLVFASSGANMSSGYRAYGLSVRCLRD
jgi:hypothetical protein